MALSQKVKKGR